MLQKLKLTELNACATPVEPNISLTVTDCLSETSSDADKVFRFLEKPGPKHWQAVKRIVRYLIGSANLKIRYTNNSEDQNFTEGYFSGILPGVMTSYVDADYATCKETRRSVTGYIFLLAYLGTRVSSRLLLYYY